MWADARTSLIMASRLLVPDASRTRVEIPGHPLELGRKFNQRLAGVQIGALGRELVAVARALMEHLGVHKLAPSYGLMPHALGRSVGKRAIKIEKMVCFDVAGALRDDAEGTCSRNTREWRRR